MEEIWSRSAVPELHTPHWDALEGILVKDLEEHLMSSC